MEIVEIKVERLFLVEFRKYRGAIIMKNFKIIYFYDEDSNLVRIVDLWDLRQNPRKLNLRARRIERKDYH
jgi:hypothetical protein